MIEMTTQVRPAAPERAAGPSLRFRPDIEGLRAVAVAAVVLFHAGVPGIGGGYIGVDVFFVISGFLITALMLREMNTTGDLSLLRFYGRRACRILPASTVVLVAVVLAGYHWLGFLRGDEISTDARWAALFASNFNFAAQGVDYLASQAAPSPLQHFWSLAVEEQFYFVWPALLALLIWLGLRHATPVVLGLAVAASLAWSLWETGTTWSYFSPATRAWELGAGCLLALVADRLDRIPARIATAMAGVGLAGIVVAALSFDSTTPFPGYAAALPVLATVLVLAGRGDGLLARWPLRWLGRISYSLYLWHWPVVILIGREPGGVADSDVNRFALLGLSVVLAVLSTYLIEVPLRRRRAAAPARSGRRRIRLGGTSGTLILAATGMALVSLVAGIGLQRVQTAQTQARARIAAIAANPPDCFGAAALDPLRSACRSTPARPGSTPSPAAAVGSDLVPSPVAAAEDKPVTCMQDVDRAAVQICTTGPPASTATREVAVIGDSHAMAWMPALQAVAQERGWRLIALLKESCPLTTAVRVIEKPSATSCVAWNRAVQDWLVRHPSVDQVIVSASSKNEFVPNPGRTWQQTAVQGYLAAWDDLPDTVERIVVLRDVPRPRSNVVACSASALSQGRDLRGCGLPATRALLYDPEVDAAARSDRSPVVLDLSRYFCAVDYCSPGVGGVFVYRDAHHMTATFARTLTAYLAKAMPSDEPVRGKRNDQP
jgi:peptidoglycan/LPS O-acetylase OafA/YrhL